jgi:hypothetical protein
MYITVFHNGRKLGHITEMESNKEVSCRTYQRTNFGRIFPKGPRRSQILKKFSPIIFSPKKALKIWRFAVFGRFDKRSLQYLQTTKRSDFFTIRYGPDDRSGRKILKKRSHTASQYKETSRYNRMPYQHYNRCCGSGSESGSVRSILYVFGPPGSESGYGSG